MAEPDPSYRRLLPPAPLPAPPARPDALDETVVHDPAGRPWLVCTIDMLYGLDDFDPAYIEDTAELAGRYETQVFYTARAGVRGLPTGWGERYLERTDAVAGHRRWCRRVRLGEVAPDQLPDDPL
jgi:hypothetical protein